MKISNFELISEKKIFNIGNAKYFKLLKNDLGVILLKNDLVPLLSFQIWYAVGSGNEFGKTKTGLAHFLEHMMFRGTEKYPQGEFDSIIANAGGNGSNAFTGFDYTAYTVELPSDKLELIIELEADRMVNLKIDEKSLNLERGAILNERSLRVDDDPGGYSWEILLENLYTGTPYGHDTIGSKKDIETISIDDFKTFYSEYYVPNNANIVIVGDFDENIALNLIYKYFSPIDKNESLRKKEVSYDLRPKNGIIKKSFDIYLDRFLYAYKTIGVLHDDFIKLKILSVILSDTKSSFLKKYFVNTDKLLSIMSDILNLKYGSFFFIEGVLKSFSIDEILDILDKSLDDFIYKNIKETDLDIAKIKIKSDFLASYSNNYKICLDLGESVTLTDSPFYSYDLINDLEKITLKDVQEVYEKYLQPSLRFAVLLSKRKNEKL